MVKKVSVRLIAATNRDLKKMVAENTFREDLYYRLVMVEIKLPKLPERKEDLLLLERYFLERFAGEYNKEITGVTRRAQAALARYNWPGNIRELENVIGSACMVTESKIVDICELPEDVLKSGAEEPQEVLVSLETVEHRHALRVLGTLGGNKNRAAEVLGISRATLYATLERIEASHKQTD